MQAGKTREYVARQEFRVVPQIEHGDLPDHRIGTAQCLHGGERSGIRSAQHDELGYLLAGRMHECRARHETTHAVADERDLVAAIRCKAVCQRLPSDRDVEPPVIVDEHGVEASLAQGQRQLQIAVVHRARARTSARLSLNAELGQSAEGDVDGIEPEDVVRPLVRRE